MFGTALAAALWVGTALLWQLLPQQIWLYVAVVPVAQTILIAASLFLLRHNHAWNVGSDAVRADRNASHHSYIAHWHFFLLAVICLDVPFAVGQSIRKPEQLWPFYYSLAFFGAAILYAVCMNIFMGETVLMYTPTRRYHTAPFSSTATMKPTHTIDGEDESNDL